MSIEHYRQIALSADYLGEADFVHGDGYREFTLTIAGISQEEVQLPGRTEKEYKVVISFQGAKKRLIINKTNAARIKSHHGPWTKNWPGKQVTLYFDPSVRFGKQVVGGVRVKGKQ